mmetsp:Transcript_22620/g.37299  ORF Transcript_22620/g.37299 Transcript_22620/m.37299 type:complete len:811 (-) Transcript_22620:609-3041(-)|eukprot:CAMPEP_0184661860 /NCGR_PEP_ID=MMETSP0308-20130426/40590_1 /TAXON_ID=38269 /ORGANISM="Gloeochaete witrockiana, Strain SAG 46.84" /LENGTH=810 /DNA_ID=CAMNT_0027103485 /DNA_START=49 /DNA_END=2481 /DNA_ORIENTATION=-
MLAITYKRSEKVLLKAQLEKYIQSHYSSSSLAEHSAAIETLNEQSSAVRSIGQADDVSSMLYRKYLISLSLLEAHFPFGDSSSNDHVRLEFQWYDAFQPKKRCSSYNIQLERAGVIFNLAALHSQLAMGQNLATAEGLKIACNYFQIAAGLFLYLKDTVLPQLLAPPTPDLSAECLGCIVNVMLAQAQACFCEKAIKDNMKSAIVAKLAAHAAEYYDLALRSVSFPSLASHFEKHLLPIMIRIQSGYFRALAQHRQSMVAKDTDKYGEEIARLQLAHNIIVDTRAHLKNAPPGAGDSMLNLLATVDRALQGAVKDNDTIYHEVVPSIANLAALDKKSMVKPVVPSDIALDAASAAAAQRDPWADLLPVAMQQALVAYRAAVDKTVIELLQTAEGQTNLARSKLQSWNLPAALQSVDPNSPVLPQGLTNAIVDIKHECGEYPGVFLGSLLTTLNQLAEETGSIFKGAEKVLDEEEKADATARAKYGNKWTRVPSRSGPSKYLVEEVSKHRVNFQRARAADALVQDKLQKNTDVLEKLSRSESELKRLAPTVQLSSSGPSPESVEQLRVLVDQLNQLLAQREAIAEELKNVARAKTSQTTLSGITAEECGPKVAQELEPFKQQFESSYAAQAQLIQHIEAANAQFQSTAPEFVKARNALVTEFDRSVAVFRELQQNFKEGIEFYSNFQDELRRLDKKAKDFVLARNTEKEDLIGSLERMAVAPVPMPAPPPPAAQSNPFLQNPPPPQQPWGSPSQLQQPPVYAYGAYPPQYQGQGQQPNPYGYPYNPYPPSPYNPNPNQYPNSSPNAYTYRR